jgi:hypothetical protein
VALVAKYCGLVDERVGSRPKSHSDLTKLEVRGRSSIATNVQVAHWEDSSRVDIQNGTT